jgi:hypothetical protein
MMPKTVQPGSIVRIIFTHHPENTLWHTTLVNQNPLRGSPSLLLVYQKRWITAHPLFSVLYHHPGSLGPGFSYVDRKDTGFTSPLLHGG